MLDDILRKVELLVANRANPNVLFSFAIIEWGAMADKESMITIGFNKFWHFATNAAFFKGFAVFYYIFSFRILEPFVHELCPNCVLHP